MVPKLDQPRVLPANSPTGCSAKSSDDATGLRARRGTPFAVTRVNTNGGAGRRNDAAREFFGM
jgi:hypothetical protein